MARKKKESAGKASKRIEREGAEKEILPMMKSDLFPHPKNSRTHSSEQIRQIADSIKEFGFLNPILIDEGNTVIAGHARLEAAKLLKLESVPTLRVSGLSDAQVRAYIIADNKLAENAGWDEKLLQEELRDIGNADFDLTIMGFSEKELSGLLGLSEVEGLEPDVSPVIDDYLYKIEVECTDEAHQLELIEKLEGMGIKCRGLIL